jgi:hypothetical protein
MLLYSLHPPKMYVKYSLGLAMKRDLRLSFLSNGLVEDLAGARVGDDRVTIRALIDMLFWSVVIIVSAVVAFGDRLHQGHGDADGRWEPLCTPSGRR